MSWTYVLEDLSTSNLYQVRNIIGDVDQDDPLMQDEEIEYLLTQSGDDVLRAAILCCDRISARYLKKSNFSLGPYSIDISKRAAVYKELGEDLRKQARGLGEPTWTGTRLPVFDIGMMSETMAETEED